MTAVLLVLIDYIFLVVKFPTSMKRHGRIVKAAVFGPLSHKWFKAFRKRFIQECTLHFRFLVTFGGFCFACRNNEKVQFSMNANILIGCSLGNTGGPSLSLLQDTILSKTLLKRMSSYDSGRSLQQVETRMEKFPGGV